MIDILKANQFHGNIAYGVSTSYETYDDPIGVFATVIYEIDRFDILNDNEYSFRKIYVHSAFETINFAKTKYISGSTNNFLYFTCSSHEILVDKNFQRYIFHIYSAKFILLIMQCKSICLDFSDTSIDQRHCRFPSESNLKHYPVYTRGLCIQECRLELVYKTCGCIPHFYPNRSEHHLHESDIEYLFNNPKFSFYTVINSKPVCSYKKLKECVAPKRQEFLELYVMKNSKKTYIDCLCSENCVGSVIFVSQHNNFGIQSSGVGANINIEKYPLIQYRRRIIFTLTDFFGELMCFTDLDFYFICRYECL